MEFESFQFNSMNALTYISKFSILENDKVMLGAQSLETFDQTRFEIFNDIDMRLDLENW